MSDNSKYKRNPKSKKSIEDTDHHYEGHALLQQHPGAFYRVLETEYTIPRLFKILQFVTSDDQQKSGFVKLSESEDQLRCK